MSFWKQSEAVVSKAEGGAEQKKRALDRRKGPLLFYLTQSYD
jgi:hypothetical protein